MVKVYIEDAIGERVWVDHPDCKGFIENICTAFDTKMPSSNLFFSQASKPPSDSASGPGRESPGPGSGQGGGGGGLFTLFVYIHSTVCLHYLFTF